MNFSIKKVILVVLCVVFVTSLAVVAIVLLEKDNDKGEDGDFPQENNYNIEIICDDEISLYIDEGPCNLIYTILNEENINYTVDFIVDNENIMIIDGNIIPLNVGECCLTIKVLTKDKIFKKDVKVCVLPTITNAEIVVLDDNKKEVDKVFVGESYFLKITTNQTLTQEYLLFTSENINNLQYINYENNILLFSFYVEFYEETKFEFLYRNYSCFCSVLCYEYIDDFSVDFSNSLVNGEIQLFLYNSVYNEQANQDGYYSFANFCVSVTDKNLNDFAVIFEGDNIAEISNNKIIAKSQGVGTLKIMANDGSNYMEEYIVKISTINVQDVVVDVNVNEIYVGETLEVLINYFPVYALCDLYLFCQDGFKVEGNKITAIKEGEFNVIVKDHLSNYEKTFSVLVKRKLSYSFYIEINKSFLTENNATFNSDVLTINNGSDSAIIPLSYYCVIDGILEVNIECDVKYVCSQETYVSYDNFSNAIVFNVKGKGEIVVTLELKHYENVCYTFKIVIL